jgi:hypothetical protein
MPRPEGALSRALVEITVGTERRRRARAQRDTEMRLSELEQQFQFEFSGTANTQWAFASADIVFEFPFFYAPAQRDPDFDRPHFWFGGDLAPELAASPTAPIAMSAVVTGWLTDEHTGAVIGATVAIGVAAGAATPFNGLVHLTFQGYSGLDEDEVDIE